MPVYIKNNNLDEHMETAIVAAVTPKKSSLSTIPRKEADLAALAIAASKSWKNDPRFVLFWTTQAEFESNAIAYADLQTEAKKTKGSRNPITNTLKNINKDIENALKYVKGYIKDKYEDDATAYYANYGIEKIGNAYIFPKERDKRRTALELIVAALVADGFSSKKYGKAYFEKLQVQFVAATDSAVETDRSIATHTDSKKGHREYIEKVLNALIHLVQANYPDTSEAQLRIFGFSK